METEIRTKPLTVAYPDTNIGTSIDSNGVLLASIDMPGRAMNVFSMDMMDSLERLLDFVDATPAVKATVITSGKLTFLVGADLEMIRMFTREARSASYESLHALCGRLGRLFRRLEKSTKPYVAAVNGLALGGGLEVALACHERVAADDKTVQLGLPEIKLGLLPGAGGTQRLPRLINAGEAMRMLLTGEAVSSSMALELGLVHEVVGPTELIDAAKRRALALAKPLAPWDGPGRVFDAAPFDFAAPDAFERIASHVGVTAQQRAKYPAYDAIMKCVVGGWNKPMDDAGHWEMDVFVDLIRDPVAGNMVRTLFLNRQRAAKEGSAPKSMPDARAAVVGSNADAVIERLQKAKVPLVDMPAMSGTDITIVAGVAPGVSGKHVEWLRDDGKASATLKAPVGLWLADPSEYGLVAELLVRPGHEDELDVGRKLAQWLRATVLITKGQDAVLPRLQAAYLSAKAAGCTENEVLLAVALAAARAWDAGSVHDVELADVAAVLSGLYPAYAGGPFTYLRQSGLTAIRSAAEHITKEDKTLFALPETLDELFRVLDGVA